MRLDHGLGSDPGLDPGLGPDPDLDLQLIMHLSYIIHKLIICLSKV